MAFVLRGVPRGDDAEMLEVLEPFRGQRGRFGEQCAPVSESGHELEPRVEDAHDHRTHVRISLGGMQDRSRALSRQAGHDARQPGGRHEHEHGGEEALAIEAPEGEGAEHVADQDDGEQRQNRAELEGVGPLGRHQ